MCGPSGLARSRWRYQAAQALGGCSPLGPRLGRGPSGRALGVDYATGVRGRDRSRRTIRASLRSCPAAWWQAARRYAAIR